MGDLIESPWAVSFGGVALLGYGDFIPADGGISIGYEIAGQSILRPRAAFAQQAIFSPNVSNRLSFTAISIFTSHAAAMSYLLAHNAALPKVVSDVFIGTRDGYSYNLKNCRMLPCQPRIEAGCRVIAQYEILGGGLDNGHVYPVAAETPPPPITPPVLGPVATGDGRISQVGQYISEPQFRGANLPPTTDPKRPGQVWNNGGVLMMSKPDSTLDDGNIVYIEFVQGFSTAVTPVFDQVPTSSAAPYGKFWNNGGVLMMTMTGPLGDTGMNDLVLINVPTSDPHFLAQVWNNGGVLMISAG